ncbi:MAG: disulfide bond formation protein B [Bacteriovoracaceae bacterium]|jgi:disulfide bond formation protein DsbB|nr:disulfide bond formation protein B [Bacteriovoracaceae bacterium]
MTTDLKNSPAVWTIIFTCWIIACVATGGSLFFSEVMEFPPCVLCWYQRVCMYPLVLIFLIGLVPSDIKVFKFSAPLIIMGWIIALYHNLLHYGIVPESASPCREGVSCSDVWLDWLGFITIPLMSFTAFTLLGLLLLISYRRYIR